MNREKATGSFKELDYSEYPDFYQLKTPTEKGLWVLLVAKEKLNLRGLTAEEITQIIIDVMEININSNSILKGFNRANTKVRSYRENGTIYFQIMKPGQDFILSKTKHDAIDFYFFEPEKKYSCKRMIVNSILNQLRGELRIIDPYIGERTLDIFKNYSKGPIKILTCLSKVKHRDMFLREYRDFVSEKSDLEIRDNFPCEIHDRFISSKNTLILLVYSLKDLGKRESYAIMLERKTAKTIVDLLWENFDKKWNLAKII
jgi:hypothetical protein